MVRLEILERGDGTSLLYTEKQKVAEVLAQHGPLATYSNERGVFGWHCFATGETLHFLELWHPDLFSGENGAFEGVSGGENAPGRTISLGAMVGHPHPSD